MSRTTPVIDSQTSNEYRRRLRSYQTPPTLRRSPQFPPQNQENNPPIFTPSKTTPDPSQSAPVKKTLQRCSSKYRRVPLRSIENNPVVVCRRSARLASDSSSEKSVDHSQERRWSIRLLNSGKIEDKGELDSTKARLKKCSTKCQGEGLIDFGDSSKKKEEENVDLGTRGAEQRSQKVRFVDLKDVLGKLNVGIDRNPTKIEDKGISDSRKCSVNKETQKRCPTECQKKSEKSVVDSAKVWGKENAGINGLDCKMGEGGGEKGRKRKIVGECEEKIEREKAAVEKSCGFGGWTEGQEAALQRAYLAAKPSPHFWKKVSKMVPGKSAQECFNKVNGSFVTPPQPPRRSRTNSSNLSPVGSFSLLGNKSTQPAISFNKKMSSRRTTLVAQKTVRHLLRKHCVNDQSHEADHFSVLETLQTAPAMDVPQNSSHLSSDCISSPLGLLQNCSGGSSSANRKLLSRSKPADKENLESPEVLKHIKNMALHEKYINQLHKRETRRKYVAASSSAFRACKPEVDVKAGVLKVARSALISEANQVISQFQFMQANIQSETDLYDEDDDCDDHNDFDDDEDEDEEC